MKKPNCYNCKYRRNIPGDAHSCCAYPGNDSNMFTGLFSKENQKNARKLNIEVDQHGIEMGWFLWPVNFDPVWLIRCDGFTERNLHESTIK